jgi:hypothetical protein
MTQVQKEKKGDILVVKISGSIEENVDFQNLIGIPSEKKMEVLLKEVPRINSVGVKAWIKYFQMISSKGIELKFFECSTAIVEQVNLISNFTSGGTVESIYIPFCCSKCSAELLGLFKTEDLRKLNFNIPDTQCPKCGGAATFDDIPEEYLGFLNRK